MERHAADDAEGWTNSAAGAFREARRVRGDSQHEAAAWINEQGGSVSQQQISAWERGDEGPSQRNLGPALRYVADAGVTSSSGDQVISLKAIRGGKGSVSQTSVRQALVHRLMHGPAMSDADHKVAKMLTAEATED